MVKKVRQLPEEHQGNTIDNEVEAERYEDHDYEYQPPRHPHDPFAQVKESDIMRGLREYQ